MIFASEIEKSANKNQISEKPKPMIYKKSSQLQIEEEILKQLTLMFELNCQKAIWYYTKTNNRKET